MQVYMTQTTYTPIMESYLIPLINKHKLTPSQTVELVKVLETVDDEVLFVHAIGSEDSFTKFLEAIIDELFDTNMRKLANELIRKSKLQAFA